MFKICRVFGLVFRVINPLDITECLRNSASIGSLQPWPTIIFRRNVTYINNCRPYIHFPFPSPLHKFCLFLTVTNLAHLAVKGKVRLSCYFKEFDTPRARPRGDVNIPALKNRVARRLYALVPTALLFW